MKPTRSNGILWRQRARLWLLPALAVLVACGGPRMKMLTKRHYPARPPSYPVALYESGLQTAHEEVALVDSIAVVELTTETQKALVEDLRSRARRVGADAVKDVRMLIRADRGAIPDPQTPFRSWRQGWTDRYYLRGCAVRFKPLSVEAGSGDTRGQRFEWRGGERPTIEPPQQPAIEVYEFEDREGRRGFASRPAGAAPQKVPRLETGD